MFIVKKINITFIIQTTILNTYKKTYTYTYKYNVQIILLIIHKLHVYFLSNNNFPLLINITYSNSNSISFLAKNFFII